MWGETANISSHGASISELKAIFDLWQQRLPQIEQAYRAWHDEQVGITADLPWLLVATAVACVAQRPLDVATAQAVGAELAHELQKRPDLLPPLHAFFAEQLAAGLSPDQLTAVYPHITHFLAHLASSYGRQLPSGAAPASPIRQRLQQERRDTRRYRRALETVIDASFTPMLVHSRGRVVAVNTAVTTYFGYQQQALLGQAITAVVRQIAPDSYQLIEQQMGNRSEGTYTAVCMHKDGTPLTVEIVGKAITYRGRTARLALVRTLDDIPEKLEATALSSRQREVLQLIAQGYLNSQIAAELDITINTVKHHSQVIYRKLGVANRQEAASWWWQRAKS